MHRKVAAALAAALALGVASCGGGEAASGGGGGEVAQSLEAACVQGQQAFRGLLAASSGHMTGAAQVHALAVFLAGQRNILARAEGLHASAARRADLEAFKQALKQRMEVLARVAATGDAAVGRAMTRAQPQIRSTFDALAAARRRLGVEHCI